MEQTNNIVGNFRIAIGGVVITFNIMGNPETIKQDLGKANAICDNVLSHLGAPQTVNLVAPIVVAQPSKAEIEQVAITMVASGENTTQVAHADEIKIDNTEIVATANVPPTVEAEPVYTLADLRKSLSEIIDLGHRPAAEQYVQFHCKTKRTSEIAPEKYPAIIKDLAVLADGLRGKKFGGYDDFAKAMGYELSTGEQE